MSHALHYGSSVFEGIRSYDTPDGPAIFRLSDHNRRLFASARIHDMAIPYSLDEINAACRAVLQENTLGKAYLRPVAWRGLGGFGLSAERSEEHTSELQSLMRISYAVFCLKKTKNRYMKHSTRTNYM